MDSNLNLKGLKGGGFTKCQGGFPRNYSKELGGECQGRIFGAK